MLLSGVVHGFVVCCLLCLDGVAGRVEQVVQRDAGGFSIDIKKPAEAGFFRCTN